ncbi:MAG TPA: PepSY domain-containing protein, partial [Gammaproteobacteria bacterium]|nr:PepSY domain-containing protein [Gammaproteobacteria bacterium]
MNRYFFLLHRYLGIAVGLVLSVWCLSGVVMMYVQYPELSETEQVATLEPLDLSACCELPWESLDTSAPIDTLRIEMMAATPVLRIVYAGGQRRLVSLTDGTDIGVLDSGR